MTGTEWRRCACGERFQRPCGAAYGECLRCEFSARLAAGGITPDDPGLALIADWNGDARVRWAAARNQAATQIDYGQRTGHRRAA